MDGDVRIKDGEITVLGGIIERTDTHNISGWPGFAESPCFDTFSQATTSNTLIRKC